MSVLRGLIIDVGIADIEYFIDVTDAHIPAYRVYHVVAWLLSDMSIIPLNIFKEIGVVGIDGFICRGVKFVGGDSETIASSLQFS